MSFAYPYLDVLFICWYIFGIV